MSKSSLKIIFSLPILLVLAPGFFLLRLLGAKTETIFSVVNDIIEGNH